MRVMVIVKASEDSENGQLPTAEEFARMGQYNEQLVQAGIMLAGDGLTASRQGKRVRFGKDAAVLDGPFAETKELVAGFWIWQVSSMDEAVEWAKRAPFPDGQYLELRKIMEADDLGEGFTADVQAAEQKLRDQIATQQQ